jgi:hypothetical protein
MWRSTFAVEWATDVAIILVLLGGLHMWCCYGGHSDTVGCATDVLIVLLLLYRATNGGHRVATWRATSVLVTMLLLGDLLMWRSSWYCWACY